MHHKRTPLQNVFVLIISLFFSTTSAAQNAGLLDETFNATDVGLGKGDGFNNYVHTILQQADGKVLVGGIFGSFEGLSAPGLVRLNADGTRDATFSPTFQTSVNVEAIATQSDGKVVVGGIFTSGGSRNIARFSSAGVFDATFGTGTGTNHYVYAIAVQGDGKILIGGEFTEFNEEPVPHLARLNADGTLDETFVTGNGPNAYVTSIRVLADGDILIAGNFTNYNGTSINRVARLNGDGSIDAGFTPGGGANALVTNMEVQSDGKILLGGAFSSFNSQSRNRVVRLNSNGTLDNTFTIGTGFNSFVRGMTLQPDQKILVGGTFTSYNGTARNGIIRLNTDGTVDTDFDPGTGTAGPNRTVEAISVHVDGRVLLGGNFRGFHGKSCGSFAAVQTDGSIDESYLPGYGVNGGEVYDSEVQPDGKILIVGSFGGYNGAARIGIARINEDGSLDPSFDPGTGASAYIRTVSLQTDGKIIVGGAFNSFNGVTRNNLARLNSDGSLDLSFNPGAGPNNIVWSSLVQDDGQILIAGDFTTYAGTSRNRIARVNSSDGTLDATFDPGTGANSRIVSLTMQEDGNFLIGGLFSAYNDEPAPRIARVLSTGGFDATFNPGTGPNQVVNAIAVQEDGKILLGGDFNSYNGSSVKSFLRIDAAGAIDPGLTLTTGPNGTVRTIIILSNGKMLLGGNFRNWSGKDTYGLARLNADGTLDLAMNTTTAGGSYDINSLQGLTGGKILACGQFTMIKTSGRNRIARVFGGQGTPVITWANPSPITFGTALGATQLNAQSTASGTFVYTPPAGTMLSAGNDQVLSVDFTPNDPDSWIAIQDTEVTIDVLKASQSITFDPLPDRIVGDPDFEVEATATSGLPVTFESNNTAVATVSGNVVSIVGPGLAGIRAMQDGNENYNFAINVVRSFHVKETQSITFPPIPAKTYGDNAFDLLPVTSSAGLAITYASSNTDVATISGRTVTIVGAGTTTITATQDGNTSFAPAEPIEQVLEVSKAAQTITFTAIPLKNILDPFFSLSTSASSGLPVTYTSSDEAVATVDLSGTVSIVSIGSTTITATQSGNANYLAAPPVEQLFTVTKAPQTIDFETLTAKTYGDADFDLQATASTGMTVTFESSNTSVAVISGTTVEIVGAGTTEITALQQGNAIYNAVEAVQTLTVSKAEQFIGFDDFDDRTYGDDPFTLSATSTAGLEVIFESSDPAVAAIEGNTVTITGAGSATITATQPGNANYLPAVPDTKFLSVFKADQTITFPDIPFVTYGDEDFTLEAISSSGLPVAYESSSPNVATVNGNVVTIHNAGMTTIYASQIGDDNYFAATTKSNLLVVEKRGQVITFDPLPEKVTTDAPFALTATSSSGLPVAFFSTNVQVAFVIDNTATIVSAGIAPIMATQNGDDNHLAATPVFQDLIVKTSQTITFDTPDPRRFGDAPFQLNGTASSSLPVSYESSNPLVATTSGNTVTITGPGSTTITASQAGNAEFAQAADVSRELIVGKGLQQITFDPLPIKHTGDAPFPLVATVNSDLAVSFSSSDPVVASISGSTVTIHTAGSTIITASQDGNGFYEAAEPVSRELVIDILTAVEGQGLQAFAVYPNPAKGQVNILRKASSSGNATVSVYNTLNVLVLQQELSAAGDRFPVDLSHLAKGVYLVQLKERAHCSYVRLVVE